MPKSKISPQTKSFVILVCIALVGTFLSVELYQKINSFESEEQENGVQVINYPEPQNGLVKNAEAFETVDTSAWKTYNNEQFGISFLYEPSWKVLPAVKKGDFTVIEIDPGAKYYNFGIYISGKDYYIMDGLPTTKIDINGQQALSVNNMLYGIQKDSLFYTADMGKSVSLKQSFDALVHSIKLQ